MEMISISYYTGLVIGLIVWMYFLYWTKHGRDPTIAFDKKYLVPFIFSVIIAVFQLLLELSLQAPAIAFADPTQAFIAGFTVYVAIQEIIKGFMNTSQVNYFEK